MKDEYSFEYDVWELNRVGQWKLMFSWIPRKCYLSNKQLFAKFAYKGTRIITGPGLPEIEHYWLDKTEFLIWNLKGRR